MAQANKVIGSGAWFGRAPPGSAVAQKAAPMHLGRHPFGSYCPFKAPKRPKTGKWQPSSGGAFG